MALPHQAQNALIIDLTLLNLSLGRLCAPSPWLGGGEGEKPSNLPSKPLGLDGIWHSPGARPWLQAAVESA